MALYGGEKGRGVEGPKTSYTQCSIIFEPKGKIRPLHIPQPHAQSPIRFHAVPFKRIEENARLLLFLRSFSNPPDRGDS